MKEATCKGGFFNASILNIMKPTFIIPVIVLLVIMISCKKEVQEKLAPASMHPGPQISLSFIDEHGNDLLLPSTNNHLSDLSFFWYLQNGTIKYAEDYLILWDSAYSEPGGLSRYSLDVIYDFNNGDRDKDTLIRYIQVRSDDIDTILIDRTREANDEVRSYIEFFYNDSLYDYRVESLFTPTVILKKD